MIGRTGANKECDPQVNGIYGCLDDGRDAQPRTREDKEGTHTSLDECTLERLEPPKSKLSKCQT